MYTIIALLPHSLVTALEPHRQKFDPQANIIPPHITVVEPFEFSGPYRSSTTICKKLAKRTHLSACRLLAGTLIPRPDINFICPWLRADLSLQPYEKIYSPAHSAIWHTPKILTGRTLRWADFHKSLTLKKLKKH